MSFNLYYRRVSYKAGQGGFAKEGELQLALDTAPPVFPGVDEIEFGEIHRGKLAYEATVRERACDRPRLMEPPEIIAMRAWLSGMLKAVMRAAKRPPPAKERRK